MTRSWIVKNSWGGSYGDGGYIKMQRGLQHPYGLCCINCMPQYAVGIRGPPPTPAPPPAPPAPLCNATPATAQRCFNVSGLNVTTSLLPNPGGRAAWTDTQSWQTCATSCAWEFQFEGNWSVPLNNWTGPGWQIRRTARWPSPFARRPPQFLSNRANRPRPRFCSPNSFPSPCYSILRKCASGRFEPCLHGGV